MSDFQDENDGYLLNKFFMSILSGLDLKSGLSNLSDNIFTCYQALVREKFFQAEELDILSAWLEHF